MSASERIENEYQAKTREIRDQLSRITGLLDEHYAKAGGKIDWGHIGDLGEVRERLGELVDFLGDNA